MSINLGVPDRTEIRLGLPIEGQMHKDTREFLKDCQMSANQTNNRHPFAQIPQLPRVEVWYQQPTDIVRKVISGELDLGIVGSHIVSEYSQGIEDLIIVHDDLGYGEGHLSIAIPNYCIFKNVNSLKELAEMPRWTDAKPLRVATKFPHLGSKFMKDNELKYVAFSNANKPLDAAPIMGKADAIFDLVSSGSTLIDKTLKDIEGGVVLHSKAVLVASRKSLTIRKEVLDTTREILERLEAHLRASGQFTVTAHMKGGSAEEIAEKILSQPSLSGLQGPTISPVFCKGDGKVSADYFAIEICVPKMALFTSVQQLREIGASKVRASELTYIFDEETPRWHQLLSKMASKD